MLCSKSYYAWVKWCCSQPAELQFDNRKVIAFSEVQQGDPLGALLFSFVILQCIDAVQFCDLVQLNLWYLNNGTFVSKQSSLLLLLSVFVSQGLPDDENLFKRFILL